MRAAVVLHPGGRVDAVDAVEMERVAGAVKRAGGTPAMYVVLGFRDSMAQALALAAEIRKERKSSKSQVPSSMSQESQVSPEGRGTLDSLDVGR